MRRGRVPPYTLALELTSFATDDVRRIAEEFTRSSGTREALSE